jgi:hypothetical protein
MLIVPGLASNLVILKPDGWCLGITTLKPAFAEADFVFMNGMDLIATILIIRTPRPRASAELRLNLLKNFLESGVYVAS